MNENKFDDTKPASGSTTAAWLIVLFVAATVAAALVSVAVKWVWGVS